MAILTTGNTYSDGDQVTSTNLNASVNSATFAAGAVDTSTTELSSGKIAVKDGGISPSKLSTGAPSWDTTANGITTFVGAFPTLDNVNFIHPNDDIGAINISGGQGSTAGANLWLYGPSHTGTRDNDIEFLNDSTQVLDFDSTASLWDFQANDITTTGLATVGDLTLNAATPEILGGDTDGEMYISPGVSKILGGNVVLYGDTHATKPSDIVFRAEGVTYVTIDGTTAAVTSVGDITTDANLYADLYHSTLATTYARIRYGTVGGSVTDIDFRVTSGVLEWRLDSGSWQNNHNATINTETASTYTLALVDAGGIVERNNASANTVTIPTNAAVAFPLGTRIDITQYGAGATTVDGAGVTLRGNLNISAQYEGVSIYKRATDEWVITGGTA